MINITKRAAKELSDLLKKKVDLPSARLRIMDRGEGVLGLGIDIEAPTDYVVAYRDTSVLVIGKDLAKRLSGITLDVEETSDGAEFVFWLSGK